MFRLSGCCCVDSVCQGDQSVPIGSQESIHRVRKFFLSKTMLVDRLQADSRLPSYDVLCSIFVHHYFSSVHIHSTL